MKFTTDSGSKYEVVKGHVRKLETGDAHKNRGKKHSFDTRSPSGSWLELAEEPVVEIGHRVIFHFADDVIVTNTVKEISL